MANIEGSQLPQKYQERLLARRRGLGTPKKELRSFKIIVSSGNETPELTESQATPMSWTGITRLNERNAVRKVDILLDDELESPQFVNTDNEEEPSKRVKRTVTRLNECNVVGNVINDTDDKLESPQSVNTDSEEEPSRRVKRTVTRLNECNVVGNVINDTDDKLESPQSVNTDSEEEPSRRVKRTVTRLNEYELDDNKFSKEFQYFKKEAELRLIEQSDLVDEHIALQSSLQKAKLRIRQLRTDLLNVQRHHDKVYSELHKERSTFRMDEENRKKLEQIHTFLSDLELLRISVMSRDSAQDKEEVEILDDFEGLLASVTSRCCDVSNLNMIFQSSDSIRITDAGNLGVLRRFNSLLENCENIMRQSADIVI
ncbi:18348_t:CDS:2, partial [Gigaspora margarita]